MIIVKYVYRNIPSFSILMSELQRPCLKAPTCGPKLVQESFFVWTSLCECIGSRFVCLGEIGTSSSTLSVKFFAFVRFTKGVDITITWRSTTNQEVKHWVRCRQIESMDLRLTFEPQITFVRVGQIITQLIITLSAPLWV